MEERLKPCPRLALRRNDLPQQVKKPVHVPWHIRAAFRGSGSNAFEHIPMVQKDNLQASTEFDTAAAAADSSDRAADDDGGWVMPDAMVARLKQAFETMDKDKDGVLRSDEWTAAQTLMTSLTMDYGISMKVFEGMGNLSEGKFCALFQREWELGRKEQALSRLQVVRAVAECVAGGSPEYPLGSIDGMSEEEVGRFLQEKVARRLKDTWLEERRRMGREGKGRVGADAAGMPIGGKEQADKVMEGKCGTELKFGELSDFYGGLVEKIGLPDPNLIQGMRREHCEMGDSEAEFEPGNYEIVTTPKAEWLVATDPQEGGKVYVEHRKVQAVCELLCHAEAKEAGLIEAEVTALLLYTGPMFRKYNAVLRQFPEQDVVSLKGNKYATTLHCIVSGVIKLSRNMSMPDGRVVFRGLGGRDVPDKFKRPDKHGVRGGVEYGLMSTTLDKSVALQYAGGSDEGGLATIFEIGLSAVSRGASLGWLSQFAHEEEILMPPLSFLEVDKDVRIEPGQDGRLVRVIPLAASANMTCSTIEDIVGKRKLLHMSQMENAVHEIRRTLLELAASSRATQRFEADPSRWEVSLGDFVDAIVAQARDITEKHGSREAEWYNIEGQSQSAMRDLVELRSLAVGQFEAWLADPSFYVTFVIRESMQQVRRRKTAQLVRCTGIRLESAFAEEAEPNPARRERALELCKLQGTVIESADEKDEHGETPLVAAGAKGDVFSLKLLLAAGCKVQSVSSRGQTALHTASMTGYVDSVRLLIKQGADVNAKDVRNLTCLHLAAQGGHLEIVKLLHDEGGLELLEAADDGGYTAIISAAEWGHPVVVQALIDYGANINRLNKWSKAALSRALCGKHVECARILIEAGADINTDTKAGKKALFYAADGVDHHVLRSILDRGANANCRSTSGETALMWAAAEGRLRCVEALIQAGADVNARSNAGSGALGRARSRGHLGCVRALLEAGAEEE